MTVRVSPAASRISARRVFRTGNGI
jgi:hypothetical protein